MRGQARDIITVQQLWAKVFPALRQGMVELEEYAFIFGLLMKLLEQPSVTIMVRQSPPII